MNKLIAAALTAGAAVAAIASIPAEAREGCGRGGYRGPHGRCVSNYNRGPAVVRQPTVRLVIGNYYNGRGYWDGRQYYQNRYRHGGGWRYR